MSGNPLKLKQLADALGVLVANLETIAATCGLALVMLAITLTKGALRRHRRRKLKAELELRRAALRLAYAVDWDGIDHRTIYAELYTYGRSVHQQGFSVAVCKHQMKNLLLNALQIKA